MHLLRKISFTLLVSLIVPAAQAATLLFDGFDGSTLNESIWRLPVGSGTFFGHTQIKPPIYHGDRRPVVSGGAVTLSLDTYNPSALTSGDSFWGHEIQSYQQFTVGSGLSIKSRIRFVDTPPGGIVGGFFTTT